MAEMECLWKMGKRRTGIGTSGNGPLYKLQVEGSLHIRKDGYIKNQEHHK